MKKITVTAILILSVFSFATLLLAKPKAQPKADPASVKLWNKYIKDKPGLILDNWGLVGGLLLCKQAGSLDNRLANFATVVFSGSYGNSIGEFALSEKKFIIFAQNLKGTALTDKEKQAVKELFKTAKKAYGDRSLPMKYGTYGMGEALKLGLTVNKKSWLDSIKATFGIGDKQSDEPKNWFRRALLRIGKYHGWIATLEEGKNISFNKYKKAVNKHIPVLLENNGVYYVAAGYLEDDKKQYLVIINLSIVPLEKKGMTYLPKEKEYFESLPPDNPRRKMYEGNKKMAMFAVDLQIRSKMPLPIGITIEPFEKGKYHAYFIHSWKKSVEAWEPEIRKIIGEEK